MMLNTDIGMVFEGSVELAECVAKANAGPGVSWSKAKKDGRMACGRKYSG